MNKLNPLERLEEEVFPDIEGFEYESGGQILSEEFDSYHVDRDQQLLTEETEELRSYDVGYQGYDFLMSVELGKFKGSRAIGISAEAGNRLQDDEISRLVMDVADAYDTSRTTLGHGDYILDIEDW
jgi:hypothetical protein